MTRKLLDTTFLIHYWAGTPAVEDYLDEHEQTTEFVTTPINLKEIVVGRTLQGKFDRTEIHSTFEWVDIVPFGSEHAFHAGELEAELRSTDGHNQDKLNSLTADLLIAAVAKALDIPVVTRNTDDFELLGGVDVETY
ncbi:type II toxin-antitoxin system VapC family toxin [Natronorubrum texcoconense]|uniref:Ribonuclease VapC n=1 Tax=Natronorubrum texcoconense TaxID=1095776 RepID=A0A1G8Y8N7_9EURY|nr:PIN domain-containing protein [Natronorubrum texcoconense]SDJ99037.1 hypothetical protein SAMN04515672_2064 [Natronorubrum texcoconense]